MPLVFAFVLVVSGALLTTMGVTGASATEVFSGKARDVTSAASSASSSTSASSAASSSYSGSYTGTASGSEKQNVAELMAYFQKQGLSKAGAAALVGNFTQESNDNPGERNGYLAQWLGGRLTNLENYASSTGQSVTSLGTQAEFVMQELKSYPSLLALLKTTDDPASAAVAVSNTYERPAPASANNTGRAAYATAAYNGTL